MEEKEREREREKRSEENIITCNDYHDNRLQIVLSYRYMHEGTYF